MSDEVHTPPTVAELAPIEVPPALIEACQDEPELLTMLARGQLALVQQRMVQKILNHPDASIGQFVAVHERLAKIAKIEGNQAQGPGSGAQQVVINIIRAPGKEQVTIEGEAKRVEIPSE